MTDRIGESDDNIALLIDADNASPDHLDEVLLVLGELGDDQRPPRLRQLGQGEPQGLGHLDRASFDRPDAAVRRRQGQERDRHADDDRCDGPALSRQCRRLRDHVERQRFPAPRPAHPRGRPAGLWLRHRQDPAELPAGLHPLLRCRRACQRRQERLDRPTSRRGPTARSTPSCSRCSARPSRRRSATRKAMPRCPKWASGPRRCRASRSAITASPACRDLIKAVPNFEVKTGDDGRLLVRRLR